MKICQKISKFIKMEQKNALYMKIKLCFIVAGNIKLPYKSYLQMKLYPVVRSQGGIVIMRTLLMFNLYVHCVTVCI